MASPYYRCPNCHNVSRKNDNTFEMVEASGSGTLFVSPGGVPCPDCGASHSFDEVYVHPKYDVPIEDVYGGKAGVDLQLVRRAHQAGKIRLSEQELALLSTSLPAAATSSSSKANTGAIASVRTTNSPLLSYWIPLGLIVLLSAVFYFLTPVFADARNLINNILFAVAANGLIACAMTFMIASGDVDLSPGAVLAWASMLFGVMLVNWEWPWALALVVVLLQAALLHAIVGVIRVTWQAPAFLVTLGLATVLTGINRAIGMITYPESLGRSDTGIVGLLVVFAAITALVFHLVGTRTGFGRLAYQDSPNSKPLRLFSSVGRVRIGVFALSGLMAALSGVLLSYRLSASLPGLGQGVEITVIAAVLLGGGRLFGGSGSIPGAMLWLIVFAIIENGLNLAGLPFPVSYVIQGLILLLAVMIGMLPSSTPNRDKSST